MKKQNKDLALHCDTNSINIQSLIRKSAPARLIRFSKSILILKL